MTNESSSEGTRSGSPADERKKSDDANRQGGQRPGHGSSSDQDPDDGSESSEPGGDPGSKGGKRPGGGK